MIFYANYSLKLVKRNLKLHNPDSSLLIGKVEDVIFVKKIKEKILIGAKQDQFKNKKRVAELFCCNFSNKGHVFNSFSFTRFNGVNWGTE